MRKLAVVFLLVFVTAMVASAADTVVEEIVARINSSIITRNDLEKAKDQIMAEARDKGEDPDQAVAKHQADMLRDLIDQKLLIQKAAELDITGDTELVKKLDDMRKQMGLSSMEELEDAATKQGISFEDFKQNLRNNIVTQAVISREVGQHIQITPAEEQQFYDEHKQELDRPEEVSLSEILIAPVKPGKDSQPAPDPSPEQLAAAEKNANDVLTDLKKGAKFDEEARKFSDGPTAAQGGELGGFRRGTLAKELEDKTFALKPGQITDVIRTRQGFVILKVDDHIYPGVPPLKDVESNVQEAIYLKKLQPALRDYLTKLREDAFIDIKQGYVDTGASPNETKPVYMAADTQPEAKVAKKKKKRFLVF